MYFVLSVFDSFCVVDAVVVVAFIIVVVVVVVVVVVRDIRRNRVVKFVMYWTSEKVKLACFFNVFMNTITFLFCFECV